MRWSLRSLELHRLVPALVRDPGLAGGGRGGGAGTPLEPIQLELGVEKGLLSERHT